jgi:hypothetical protein
LQTCRKTLDERLAWRLFSYNWVPLGLMALALVLAMALAGFSIKITSTPLPIGMAATTQYCNSAPIRTRKFDEK